MLGFYHQIVSVKYVVRKMMTLPDITTVHRLVKKFVSKDGKIYMKIAPNVSVSDNIFLMSEYKS